MAYASPALTSFAAGELSTQMDGRVDVDKYGVGAHAMENFMALVQGPAMRRPGTRFAQETKNSANRGWLRRFEFSTTQAFQIEYGDKYCRFYTNHGALLAGTVTAWSNATAYTVGDLASLAGVNYYCILAHTNQSPPNATYWYAMTGNLYEIPSPYAVADLTNSDGAFAFQTEQSGDVLYIAGAGIYQPYTLTRYSNTRWIFAAYAPTDGPFLELNANKNIAIGASATTGSVTLTAYGANVFAATDVGRLVRLAVQSFNVKPWSSNTAWTVGQLARAFGNTYLALNTATSGPTPPAQTSGTQWDGLTGVQWLYQDSGYGIAQITAYTSPTQVTATVLLQLPADVVTSTAVVTAITQANPAVVSAVNAFAVGDPVFLTSVGGMTQVNNLSFVTGAVSGATFSLAGINSTAFTAYTSGGTAVKNATTRWQLGAWSGTTEYPRTVAFFSDRLFWGGKLRWWGSVPGLYTSHAADFNGQVTTDAAVNGILSAQDVNAMVWMSSANLLLIGTQGGEFGLGPITTTAPLGPDNVRVVRQSKQRCRAIRPELIGTSVLYVQRAGRKTLAMDYNFYLDRYDSTNQQRLSYDITQTGVIDMAYQAEPFQILWQVRSDGLLIGYTFDREDNVTGWHRHPIGGNGIVESVSVTPAPDGQRDEVWLIVRRTINGVTRRYVEFIEKHYEPGDLQSSCFYLDSGATYSGAPATTISGLGYLEGQTVSILKDGGVHPDRVVTGGQIVLQSAGSVVQVGLRCSAKLVTMRIEAGANVGTSQGKTKRVTQGTIRVINTLGGKYGMDNGTLADIRDNDPAVMLDNPPPIYSGDSAALVWPGDYDTDCRLQIQQDDPLPITVVGLFPYLTGAEPT